MSPSSSGWAPCLNLPFFLQCHLPHLLPFQGWLNYFSSHAPGLLKNSHSLYLPPSTLTPADGLWLLFPASGNTSFPTTAFSPSLLSPSLPPAVWP